MHIFAELITPKQRVIEIGAGTGAVGLAAAALGATVILTDLDQVEGLITANIARNKLSANASFTPLCWGDPIPSQISTPPFDIVLASDVLYQHEWVSPLIATLKALSGPATDIFLANEHRPKLKFPADLFSAAGFLIQQIPYEQLHPEWRSPDIQIYKLKLSS